MQWLVLAVGLELQIFPFPGGQRPPSNIIVLLDITNVGLHVCQIAFNPLNGFSRVHK